MRTKIGQWKERFTVTTRLMSSEAASSYGGASQELGMGRLVRTEGTVISDLIYRGS